MLAVRDVAGKGRATFAKRPLRAGETIMREAPALLVVTEELLDSVCASCMTQGVRGPTCPCGSTFCSAECWESAHQSPFWHSPQVCEALKKLDRRGLSNDDATSMRFLLHAKAAKAAATAPVGVMQAWSATQLTTAQGLWNLLTTMTAAGAPHERGQELHKRLSDATGDAAGLTLEEVESLLRKEASNSYGIMASSGAEGARRIRGSGLYPSASLINHDCLPNAARFDNFDAAPVTGRPGDVEVSFRMLHDLPAGEEVTASYFPLTTPQGERQQRCRELYGFECSCPRCIVESAWSDDDQDEAEDMEADDAAEEAEPPASGGIDDAYIQVFMLKYVCPQEDCSGTLAPGEGSGTYTCNMCGGSRTEAEFLRELQAY